MRTPLILIACIISLALALSLVLTLSASPATYNVPELIYYKFDNAGGTSVSNDASAPVGNNPAPVLGHTIGGAGQFGNALVSSGNNYGAHYVDTGWNTNLGTGSWTISFWISTTGWTGGIYYVFGDNSGSRLRCFVGGIAGDNNLVLRANGMSNVIVTGVGLAQPAVVHFVYDSTVPEIRAYLNGVLNNTVSQPPLNITGSGPFKFGSYAYSESLPSGGLLDEFRVYNRALSAAEITATWNQPLPTSGYTLQTNVVGSGAVTRTPALTTYPAGTPVTLTAIANPGHTFAGWSGDCAGQGDCALTMTANKVATATFEARNSKSNTITIAAPGAYPFGGGICGGIYFTNTGTVPTPQITVTLNYTYPSNSHTGLQRQYKLETNAANYEAAVTLCYEQAELDWAGIADETQLHAYRYQGTVDWQEYSLVDPLANTITAYGVNDLGVLGIGVSGNAPTAVTLRALNGVGNAGSVKLLALGLALLAALGGAALVTRARLKV